MIDQLAVQRSKDRHRADGSKTRPPFRADLLPSHLALLIGPRLLCPNRWRLAALRQRQRSHGSVSEPVGDSQALRWPRCELRRHFVADRERACRHHLSRDRRTNGAVGEHTDTQRRPRSSIATLTAAMAGGGNASRVRDCRGPTGVARGLRTSIDKTPPGPAGVGRQRRVLVSRPNARRSALRADTDPDPWLPSIRQPSRPWCASSRCS